MTRSSDERWLVELELRPGATAGTLRAALAAVGVVPAPDLEPVPMSAAPGRGPSLVFTVDLTDPAVAGRIRALPEFRSMSPDLALGPADGPTEFGPEW